jgi:hypothetical protein
VSDEVMKEAADLQAGIGGWGLGRAREWSELRAKSMADGVAELGRQLAKIPVA